MQTNADRLAKTSKMYEQNAYVYLTFRCTLSCPLCINRCSAHHPEMTMKQYERILDCLKEHPVDMLTFTGGEPTLCDWLTDAIQMAKEAKVAKRIRVGSNGFGCVPDDYKGADVVYLSTYGAQNCMNLLALKRALGKRAVIRRAVHHQHTLPPQEGILPASCGCVVLAFVGDRVYRCGYTAGRGCGSYEDLWDDQWPIKIINVDPQMQPQCKVCFWNERRKHKNAPKVVFELGFWDSRHNLMIELPLFDRALRRIMRRFGLLKR